MTWADILVAALKKAGISLIAYVPDISIHQATKLMEEDPYFPGSLLHQGGRGHWRSRRGLCRGPQVRCIHAVQRPGQLHQRHCKSLPSLQDADTLLHKPPGRVGRIQHRAGGHGEGFKAYTGHFRHSPLHPHHHRTAGQSSSTAPWTSATQAGSLWHCA